MEEFNQAISEVLTLRAVELVDRYYTGTPESGREFLCAAFVLSDERGIRRTFLYLTGAVGNFLKIRVTLRINGETEPTARQLADAVAEHLWA